MGSCYNYTPIPPAEASCIIAHLFVELALPCSCCKREDGVIVIQGKTYDGSSARVTIKGEEVRYYGKQRTLAAIRAGQCRPLGLRLNGKTQILPLKNGIDFLGFHTYLTQTGKVVRKVRAKSIDNMKRKIRKFRGLVDSGKMTLDSVVQSYASWTGHISHGNTYHLRQNMDAYFFSYFPELKPSPKGDTTHGPKTEQPRKQVEGQVRQPVRQPDRLDRGR